ncbi:alkaline phosphatase family protein [Nocardioides sp. zg-1230]|uniref:alkaline phosphatase family protein n=1 Tax=Nocardioides sp. zg-1230 TaxID=2736601 RepID=UPI0015546241|nr:alkaline phosphatase family protein [Nocardioides sp. zg-1230]NPC43631.1 sulfatase-like hydrolase/transferase [Nocardioides sp. zg-1230]
MAQRRTRLLAVVAASAVALTVAGTQSGASAGGRGGHGPSAADRPTKVVIIVVDALSKEIVEDYGMHHVQALMKDGVDTPKGYLGHTGSVTVVTHNVVTTGAEPRHMGWTTEGYRDVDGLLGAPGGLYITSNFGRAQMAPLQQAAGYPHLSDYLDDTGKVFTVSPKGYAAWGLSGPGSANTSTITFGSGPTCPNPDGTSTRYRQPTGFNVPSYFSTACGSRWLARRDTIYDTGQYPAQLYPATDDRYVVGHHPVQRGGDVWATDAVLEVMEQEGDGWSGIFVSLPGVDKAAHMWGGVNDPEGATPGYDPMTHMRYATETADAQVGRIMQALEDSGQLDDTLVVLTADHGSVAADEGHFHGDFEPENDYGYYNWYYGSPANDVPYLRPQEALLPLIEGTNDGTGATNVGLSYSDSSLNVWLKDQSPEAVTEAADIMEDLADVTAVWRRNGDHYDLASPVRWDRMHGAEKHWFATKAQELVDTQAADYGPDLIATLPDDTTYSVLGDHGGIQRASQQVPIVFAGANTSHRDLHAEVRSVDIMPTVLEAMGIEATHPMDGTAYDLPTRRGGRG